MIKRLVKVNLPNEYQRVEYLKSTGTQYIDTGIDLNIIRNINCKAENVNNSYLFWYRGKETLNYTSIMLGWNGKNTQIRCSLFSKGNNDASGSVYTVNDSRVVTFFTNNGSFKVNERSYAFRNVNYNLNLGSGTFRLFGRKLEDLETIYIYGTAKCYYISISDANNILIHLIPCYRKSDNVAGMYDLVSGQFFTNAGTGSFIVGEDVNEPIEVMKEIKAIKRYSGEIDNLVDFSKYFNASGETYFDTDGFINHTITKNWQNMTIRSSDKLVSGKDYYLHIEIVEDDNMVFYTQTYGGVGQLPNTWLYRNIGKWHNKFTARDHTTTFTILNFGMTDSSKTSASIKLRCWVTESANDTDYSKIKRIKDITKINKVVNGELKTITV